MGGAASMVFRIALALLKGAQPKRPPFWMTSIL